MVFYFFVFFVFWGDPSKIAVLPAWELNSGELDQQFCDFHFFENAKKNVLGGFLGPLGSKTPPHGPKTPPNHDFLLICVPSGLICRRFLVHIFKKKSQCSCSLVGVRECIFSKKHWNIGNETNKSVGTRPTFLATGLRYCLMVYCTPQNPNHLKLTRDSGSGMTPVSP